MKKKEIIILIATVAMLNVLGSTVVLADDLQESFLKDMSEGLAARWAYDENESTMTRQEFADYRAKLVDEEYLRLSVYADKEFEDYKFNVLAHAYIDAVETQKESLSYYNDIEALYEIEWQSGYSVRALVIPTFVDSYGLVADEEYVKDFRAGTTYTVDVSVPSNTISSTDTEFEIYNNEGIIIYVTGTETTAYSKVINFRIENLNHHDIIVATKDYQLVINGNMIASPLHSEVKSGKTSNTKMELYNDELNKAGIDEIKDISFNLTISDSSTYTPLYYSDQINLTVDEEDNISVRTVYSDKETIRQVQALLNSAGYDCGTADGVPGKKTNSAILQFEKDHGLKEDTDITPELLAILQASIHG